MTDFKRLPDAELVVMQAVWAAQEEPVSSAELIERLSEPHGWKATSILTFLTRLCEKGYLRCEKMGKRNGYTALVDEAAYRARVGVRLLDRVYGGSVRELVASLTGAGAVSPEELAELREFLDSQGREPK